ncbi:transcription factor, partial [Blyttiomyces helicus]
SESIQLKECRKILQNLKRLRDAPPFLVPVDPDALGIPTYFQVIKKPMDISTIEKKLSAYTKAQEFIDDVDLMFNNCYLFNGKDSPIGLMAQNLETSFRRQLVRLTAEVSFASTSP